MTSYAGLKRLGNEKEGSKKKRRVQGHVLVTTRGGDRKNSYFIEGSPSNSLNLSDRMGFRGGVGPEGTLSSLMLRA